MKINCKNCYHNWEENIKSPDLYFCHKCGYDNKKQQFNISKLEQWMKNNQKIVSEEYKNKLKKLAGIIRENSFIDNDGNLNNFSFQGEYIPGDAQFKYSITYQEVDRSQFGDDEDISDYTDRGFEEEESIDELYNIIQNAKHNYGTYEPSSSPVTAGCWWSSTSPKNDRSYFEKGVEKYFSLHLKNLDGSNLSKEQCEFITKLLNPSSRAIWDDLDNKWNLK